MGADIHPPMPDADDRDRFDAILIDDEMSQRRERDNPV